MPTDTEFNLTDAIALLSRTPATLDVLLRRLPDVWTRSNEGGDSWSAFDIVGHLIIGERTDWMPRARIILERGESQPFTRFDRLAQLEEFRDASLDQLLDQFAHLRSENLVALDGLNLQPDDFLRRGLHQLSRVMAHQYREAVGPWTAYLGVMQCTGHSA